MLWAEHAIDVHQAIMALDLKAVNRVIVIALVHLITFVTQFLVVVSVEIILMEDSVTNASLVIGIILIAKDAIVMDTLSFVNHKLALV